MGNHNDRFALRQLGKSRLYSGFIVGIRKSCGFIQNNDGGIFQHHAGNGNPLLLAAGKVDTLGADHRIHTIRQFFKDIAALGIF